MQTIKLTTFDGVELTADYYPAEKPLMAAVYSHMMPATKESWRELAEYLAANGIAGLAIDLRGHGQSAGGPDGYKNLKSEEHKKSSFDIQAAVDYLHSLGLGFRPEKVILMGASIGANLSLKYIAEHSMYKAAVLLSPGLDYHGVNSEILIKKLIHGQKVFFIAAHDDTAGGSDNAVQNEKLFDETPEGVVKKKKIYDTGGHGTNILAADPSLAKEILEFILKMNNSE